MQFFNGRFVFSPTDIVSFFESEFASYMDHFEKTVSNEVLKKQNIHRDPMDPLYDVIIQMGNTHEKHILAQLEKNSVVKIDKEKHNIKLCIEKTISAMKNGADKIYQAAVSAGGMFGYVDILEKTEGASRLGNYHYIPYDIKISSHPTPTAIIQLCCYCDILEKIQNLLPKNIKVITKDGRNYTFETQSFFYFYKFLKKKFLEYHSSFNSENMPIPNKSQNHKGWNLFAKQKLHALEDISLVANIRQTQCEKLRKKKINTLTELSKYNGDQPKGMAGATFRTLKDQAGCTGFFKKTK